VWRNYGQETRPPGDWVRTTGMLSVQGIEANLAAFVAFADAAEAARKKGLRFGIDLAAEDAANPAIGLFVVGGAESKSFFSGPKVTHWPLGHLSAKVVGEIHEELIAQGVPIAAELASIHYDSTDPEMKIYILAPKGHSARDRERRRQAKRA
jgi:hypothetical protein